MHASLPPQLALEFVQPSVQSSLVFGTAGLSVGYDVSIEYDPRFELNQAQSDAYSTGPLRSFLEILKANREKAEKNPTSIYGAAPKQAAFDDAAAFVKATDLHRVLFSEIHFASDGELNFLWKQGGVHIDLGFYGNGKFSYCAETLTAEPMYGDDLDAAEGMPRELEELSRS